MKKILMLAASAALVSTFTGCFGDDSDSSEGGEAISGFTATVASNGDINVAGTITAPAETEITWELILNGDTTNLIGISLEELAAIEGSVIDLGALGAGIDPAEVDSGANEAVLVVYSIGADEAETEIGRATATFTITTAPNDTDIVEDLPVEFTTSVVLGAQGADEGSSLDLDSWTVYTAGSITTAIAPKIDLVTWNSADGLVVMTPAGSIANDYLTSKLVETDAVLIPTSISEADFNAIETTADVPAFDAADADIELAVEAGSAFFVLTDEFDGENAGVFLVYVSAATSGNAGTITVKALHN
jgi:hypothetical protein